MGDQNDQLKFTVELPGGTTDTFTFAEYLKAMASIDLADWTIDREWTIEWLNKDKENRQAAYVTVMLWRALTTRAH